MADAGTGYGFNALTMEENFALGSVSCDRDLRARGLVR
jgi:hypothetical protein